MTDLQTRLEAQRVMDEEWPKNRVPISKPSWDQSNMELALQWSTRSPDAESKVGAWLTNANKEPISGGYNGFPRDIDDSLLPNKRGTPECPHDKHSWVIHAEKNAIANAARLGKSTLNSIMYLTRAPCGPCLMYMWQCGVIEVVYIPYISPMINNVEHQIWLAQFDILTKGKMVLRPYNLPDQGV